MSDTTSVILVSVDGMRPDGLQQANTPNIDKLIANGAHTYNARTVMPSVTLPCHTSMFRSVEPGRHGITTNTFTPQVRPIPSLNDMVHQAGQKAFAFYNWEQLRDLSDPGSLKASFCIDNCYDPDGIGDQMLAELCAGYLGVNDFDFAFLYLGYTDVAGHDFGWMSDKYIKAIENADECVGIVMETLRSAGKRDRTAFIITSDHGGHEQTHGTEADDDMLIPVVASGCGIKKGVALDGGVSILDIAPTVTKLLGVAPHRDWAGSPIAAYLAWT